MNKKTHAKLIIIRGLPGSGKSFIANNLQTAIKLRTDDNKTVLLDPDTIDYTSVDYKQHAKQLASEGVDTALHPYRFLRAQAFRAMGQGKTIVWNQPFTNLDTFIKVTDRLKGYANEHNVELIILVVEVDIDPALARRRVNNRKQSGGHGPSFNTFKRFTNQYGSFAKHGFNTITVRGDDEVTNSVNKILTILQN